MEDPQQQPQPLEPQAPTTTLNLNPGAFCDDLYNAVHYYCAEGFDTLDRTVREQRGGVLTPEQVASCLHGSSQLYLALRQQVDTQLQKFEGYALETCLHVPAGLMAQPSPASEAEGQVDEAEEAAADEQLQQLRRQIAAAKHRGRKMKGEMAQYDAALARYSSSLEGLAAVPGTLAGKENAVAEDGRVLAQAGQQLQDSWRQLEALKQQRAVAAAERGGGALGALAGALQQRDELAAEREVLRRQPAVAGAPADHLRRLQERLAS